MRQPDRKECLDYFRSRPVYEKLFRKFRKKYESLGHFGGSVVLTDLTREEKAQLGGFLQKDVTAQKSVTVSAERLTRALSDSKFSDFTWEEILEAYFRGPLSSNKDRRQQEDEERRLFFQNILEHCEAGPGRQWLSALIEEKADGFRMLLQQYHEDKENLRQSLIHVLRAIAMLPCLTGKTERLPVFAASVTGNPHYFDEGALGERLLSAFMRGYIPAEADAGKRQGREERKWLWYRAGIVMDDLSNYTLAYGIRAQRKDGPEHPGFTGFYDVREPVLLTLLTVGQLQSARAGEGAGGRIYVVENPAVFSILTAERPEIAAVCTNGQPRLATLALMDMLCESHTFYYAGDFDPEGLLIAQRLQERYGQALRFWNYEASHYLYNLSDVSLNATRLKKLEGVHAEGLQEIKRAMYEKKRAAYQEKLVGVYLDSIKTN